MVSEHLRGRVLLSGLAAPPPGIGFWKIRLAGQRYNVHLPALYAALELLGDLARGVVHGLRRTAPAQYLDGYRPTRVDEPGPVRLRPGRADRIRIYERRINLSGSLLGSAGRAVGDTGLPPAPDTPARRTAHA